MIKLKKVTVFAVSLVLLFTNRCAIANFPAIRPVPCSNDVTGESGICTFNWSCVNVAHGVHIGPCVDRFFVGTCCKIPQKTKQDDGKAQTSGKVGKIPSYTPFHHSLATKTETKKIETPAKRGSVTLNPIDQDDRLLSFETHASKPQIVFDYKPQTPKDSNFKNSSFVYNGKPILSATFIHKLFFSGSTSKNTDIDQNSSADSAYSLNPTTDNPVFHKRGTTLGLRFQNKPVLDDSHDGRVPVSLEASHSIRKPVVSHNTHDLRQPVVSHNTHDLRQPVVAHNTHDLRQPVKTEQHDLRKPVPLDEGHDLRWPILEEDSHDQRLPVVNLYEWSGVWYLNNHQKPNSSNDFYSLTTHEFKSSTSGSTVFTEFATEPSQTFEPTTDSPISTSPGVSSTVGDDNSIIPTTSNFTLFIRPTSSQPSSEATPLIEEATPESVQGSNLNNISQVCGRSRGGGTTARIVGGRKSHYLRWPWMISLRRYEEKSYKHKCGATLLNEYWAITAAHCVDGKLPLDLILRLGEYNFRRADELHPHVERRVYVMVLHPEFDHITYENDLALLRFDEPVKLQANIVPVCLPDSMDDITGRIAVVTGWGRLSEAGELPPTLHEVHMPILSNEECEQMYYEAGYAENIRDVFVCAGLSSGGLDACEGDSGGPMVVRGDAGEWTLVGLISWGMGCAAPKQPGVYTRISQFTHWIQGIISH